MRIRKRTLKSWEKHEIKHLKKTLKKANKRGVNTNFEHASYWMVVLISVLAGMVAAAALSTAGMIIPTFWLCLIAAIIGLALGNTFSAAISELDHLKNEHHLIFTIITIIGGIISFVLVANNSIFVQISSRLGIEQQPVIVGSAYIVLFLLPYYIRILEEKYERLGHPLHKS